MIVGVPSNDFGGQEPGGIGGHRKRQRTANTASASRLRRRCSLRDRTRIHSTDGRRTSVRSKRRAGTFRFLIGRDGHVAAVFPTAIEPMDARVVNAIVKELPRPE